GVHLAEQGDALGALAWWAEGFRLDNEASPERQVGHRRRLAAALQQVPRLVRVWAHEQPVKFAEFSPDGRLVLTAAEDGTVKVWDLQSGEGKRVLVKHGRPVRHATFSPDGRRVVTASDDGTALVWNAETGQPLADPLRHDDRVVYACFNAE